MKFHHHVQESLSVLTDDKAGIEKEFDVPINSELISFHSSPSESEFSLQGEGLKIQATYKLNASQFGLYKMKVECDVRWHQLPIPLDVLKALAEV